MTELLKRAFAEASKLSPQEQDGFAAWLLKELEAERRWAKSFAESQEALAKLAAEAMTEHRSGLTHELDPDKI